MLKLSDRTRIQPQEFLTTILDCLPLCKTLAIHGHSLILSKSAYGSLIFQIHDCPKHTQMENVYSGQL